MITRKLMILLVGSVVSCSCFSQFNIAGIWEGKYLSPVAGLGEPKLVVEIYNLNDTLFSGVTHLYYEGNKYEHYKMTGWYNKKDSLLLFREETTIAVDLGGYGNCLGTYSMILQRRGNTLLQFGLWAPNIKGCTLGTKVWLQKSMEVIARAPVEIKKKETAKKPARAVNSPKRKTTKPVVETVTPEKRTLPVKTGPSVKSIPVIIPEKITRRETDVQSLIEISPAEKDSIKVDVYDNGEIDGDTVSVYEEHVPRINKRRITAKPVTFYISLDKNVNPISHLRLVAESLGSIPPCTALMIVTTRSRRYEVRLSSNFNKNATVELFLKE